jgi:TPR repeat protein
VKRDQIEAQRLFQIAADKGLDVAQFNVAVSVSQGWRGIEKNPAEAAKWFGLAAGQGYAPAQDWLGDMYWNGIGVPKNYDSALTLFASAARHEGWWLVQKKLGDIYSGKLFSGDYVKQDPVKALMWYLLSPTLKADALNLERLMLPDQINLAEAAAVRCRQSNFSQCD